jgi:hypothetical protein
MNTYSPIPGNLEYRRITVHKLAAKLLSSAVERKYHWFMSSYPGE